MRNCITLFILLAFVLSSCVSYNWVTKESKIVDITYYCEPVFFKDGTYKSETLAYFVLENGVKVPMPKNFNPSLPEQYIGKTMTYTYRSDVKLEESITSVATAMATAVDEQTGDNNNYYYVCQKKIISDNNYMIKYYTKSNPAVKTVQVSKEVYDHAREGFFMETEEFEPFVQKKN